MKVRLLFVLLFLLGGLVFAQETVVKVHEESSDFKSLSTGLKYSATEYNLELIYHPDAQSSVNISAEQWQKDLLLECGAGCNHFYRVAFANDGEPSTKVIIQNLKVIEKKQFKTIGAFSIKMDKNNPQVKFSFSPMGEKVMVVSKKGDELYYYVFDMGSQGLIVKDKVIATSQSVFKIYDISTSDQQDIFLLGQVDGQLSLLLYNMVTKQEHLIPLSAQYGLLDYVVKLGSAPYLFLASQYESYWINMDNRSVMDLTTDKFTYLTSVFVNEEGLVEDLTKLASPKSGYQISQPGVGLMVSERDVLIYDHLGNYFTLPDTAHHDLAQYVTLDAAYTALLPQPEAYPLIADVLSVEGQIAFIQQVSQACQVKRLRALAFQVFASSAPYAPEVLQGLMTSRDPYIVAYFGADILAMANEILMDQDTRNELMVFTKSYEQYTADMPDGYRQATADLLAVGHGTTESTASLRQLTSEELTTKGFEVFNANRTDPFKSLDYFVMAAEKSPDNPDYQINIGHVYMNALEFGNATTYFNKALAMRPNYPLAMFSNIKAAFEPIRIAQKAMNSSIAKSLVQGCEATAPLLIDDTFQYMYVQKAWALSELYLSDVALYEAHRIMAGNKTTVSARLKANEDLISKVEKSASPRLAGVLAVDNAFHYVRLAEKNNDDATMYLYADVMFDKAIRQGVYTLETYYHWARINIDKLHKKNEGLRIVQEAQSKFPNSTDLDVLIVDYYFEEGKKQYEQGAFTKAAQMMGKYIAASKRPVPNAYQYHGLASYQAGKYAAAKVSFDKMQENESLNTLLAYYPNFNQMYQYVRSGSSTPPTFVDNTAKIKEAFARHDEAINLSDRKDHEGAISILREVITYFQSLDFDYGLSIVYNSLGSEYLHKNQRTKATEYYQYSIEKGGYSAASYANYALILLADGELDKAKLIIDQGRAKYRINADLRARLVQYWVALAQRHYNNGDYALAINTANDALRYESDDADAMLILGLSQYGNGQREKAKKTLLKAVKLDPTFWQQYPVLEQILW